MTTNQFAPMTAVLQPSLALGEVASYNPPLSPSRSFRAPFSAILFNSPDQIHLPDYQRSNTPLGPKLKMEGILRKAAIGAATIVGAKYFDAKFDLKHDLNLIWASIKTKIV
jgi:hypothetical protein